MNAEDDGDCVVERLESHFSLRERERNAFNIVEEDDFEMHLRQVHGIKELNFPFEFYYYYLYFSFLPSMPSVSVANNSNDEERERNSS